MSADDDLKPLTSKKAKPKEEVTAMASAAPARARIREMRRIKWNGSFVILRRSAVVSDERYGAGFVAHLQASGVALEVL